MEIPLFKIRCSQIAAIMPDAKKPGELSVGAKTYCREWYIKTRYGIKHEVKSKYLDKGIACEDAAIFRYAGEFSYKNEISFEDEHFTGTPDLIFDVLIADIKCPFDAFTFPFFDTDIPNKDYWWQLQGYMALTGKQRAELVYCLEDTPPRNDWDEGESFAQIPDKERIRIFHIQRDDAAIEKVRARVEMCREYIAELHHNFELNFNA